MGARRKLSHRKTRRHWSDKGNNSGGTFSSYIVQEDGFSFTLEDGAGSIILE